MFAKVTLSDAEAALYDQEDCELWPTVRRGYQKRALRLLDGKAGSVEIYHPDGTLIDWLGAMEAAVGSSFEEFED